MYLHSPETLGEPVRQTLREPYPNIKARAPHLHPVALIARNRLEQFRWFRELFEKLANAASAAHLALDSMDQIVVVPDEQASTNLLGDKIMKDVLKSSGKSLIKHLTARDFGTALGVLDLLLKLQTALSGYDNKRLVNEQNRSRRDEAYRFKLRFFIRLHVATAAPLSDRALMAARIERTWDSYKDALNSRLQFDSFEERLDPNTPPNYRKAPVIKQRDW